MAKKTANGKGALQSFRDFARELGGTHPLVVRFKAHAKSEGLPDANDWGGIRRHLMASGADHEAIVGARMAWRQYRRRKSADM